MTTRRSYLHLRRKARRQVERVLVFLPCEDMGPDHVELVIPFHRSFRFLVDFEDFARLALDHNKARFFQSSGIHGFEELVLSHGS